MPIYHKQPPAIPGPDTLPPLDGGPMLAVSHLSFHYRPQRPVLHDITFNVGVGEKVALVGPNGAGKSTLMLHLNGLLQGEGSLRVHGLPVEASYLRQIRALVGLVFQNPDDQLFSPTVYEDVAFGPLHMGLPEDAVHERVHTALAQVGMEAYAERLSHHLSMGEKKRIALATVLSMQPAMLALDEPSAGLDPRARRQLITLLQKLPQTMLIATHDLLLVAELCSRTLVLDGGRLVADGDTASILRDRALLQAHGLELPCWPAALGPPPA